MHVRFGSAGWAAALAAALVVLGACGAAQDEPPADPSPAGPGDAAPAPRPPETGRLMGQVTFPSGRLFHVVLAITPEEQAWGYQERAAISPDEGMLFVGDGPALRRFHMRNCLVPIDMIWLDAGHQVVAIEHAAPPCRQPPCPTYGPLRLTHHVLEVRGGTAREEGLQIGDRLRVTTDLSPS